jgi:ATP-dependent exoDNAse (exonuclease V) beta subunit
LTIETQEACPLSRHRGRYEYLGITSTTLFEEKYQGMSDEKYRRWLYTGITRSSQKLVIVGRN